MSRIWNRPNMSWWAILIAIVLGLAFYLARSN